MSSRLSSCALLVALLVTLAACPSSPITPLPSPTMEAGAEAGVDATVTRPDQDASQDAPVDTAIPSQDTGPFTFLDVPFICAGALCSPDTHYCLHRLPEGGLTPEAGDLADTCVPIPAACLASPTCSCLESVAPCDSGVEGEGCVQGAGVEVSCPAGS